MEATTCQGPPDFLGVVEGVLLRREAVHGLMLGVCRRLVEDPGYFGAEPFLAVVHRDRRLALAALMTPPHNLQLATDEDVDPEAIAVVADLLHAGGWAVPGVLATRPLAEAFSSAWCKQTGAQGEVAMQLCIHELRAVVPPRPVPGALAPATDADMSLAAGWIEAFEDEALHGAAPGARAGRVESMIREGRLFLWKDNAPRSMAARTRPTQNGECISAVYTPPEYRGHGYASAVVAALSQRILDDGKAFCTLFTDLANPTSNHIYRAIGYAPVADLVEIRFCA